MCMKSYRDLTTENAENPSTLGSTLWHNELSYSWFVRRRL